MSDFPTGRSRSQLMAAGGSGATIEETARFRKAWFRELKKRQRAVETINQALERFIARVLKRKRGFATVGDLDRVMAFQEGLQTAVLHMVQWGMEWPWP